MYIDTQYIYTMYIDVHILCICTSKYINAYIYIYISNFVFGNSSQKLFETTVVGRDTGCLTVLENNGLHQEADILENYGIDSESDVSVLDQDDFSKLSSRGLKPLYVKKLDLWCDTVCERAENMLPSSLNTPASAALLSSEELTRL